jgi:hypothetical protein
LLSLSEKKAGKVSLILGGLLLLLLRLWNVPYEFIIDPNKKYHLGFWTDALKELARSGGVFLSPGSFPEEKAISLKKIFSYKMFRKNHPSWQRFLFNNYG